MAKKTKTLLVLGDEKDFDTYLKFTKQKRFFYGSSIKVKHIDYLSLLKNKLPSISSDKIIILPCFPFSYWDMHIEPKNYKGVYGNKNFYTKFVAFWKKVEQIIEKSYKGKNITYINHPQHLAKDRDKELTKKLVAKVGVLVPKSFPAKTLSEVFSLLDKGFKIFIKVRYGSMGKGIAYLEKGRWLTNFRFRNGRILSKKSDYGWSFVNITDNRNFLRQILKQDIIMEEAINPLLVKGRKFDLRIYVYKNKVLYVYGRSNDAKAVTTNISQGAKGEKTSFVNLLPKKQLETAKKAAIMSIHALGLKFGGVDIMLCNDKKNAMFIEVNTFPGFPKVRRFNLSKYLIKEIVRGYA
jgi:hypothetical protein|tara:strand:- start:10455 stop:11510 length:1056 start_codon:yes stop_codon:yes gene_type:complete